MTVDEVVSDLMHNKFSEESIRFALNELAFEGLIDVYYVNECGHCRTVDSIREENYENRTTYKAYHKGHGFCTKCKREQNIDGADLRFAIPNDALVRAHANGIIKYSILQRIRNWLTRGRNISPA